MSRIKLPFLERLLRRVFLVADRGLFSLDNLAGLDATRFPPGKILEYILAVPAPRYPELAETVTGLDFSLTAGDPAAGDRVRETTWRDRRLIVAHDLGTVVTPTVGRRCRMSTETAWRPADHGPRVRSHRITRPRPCPAVQPGKPPLPP